MSETGLNRRTYERFNADMAIWFRPLGANDDYLLIEATDISAGGMRVILDEPIDVGAWVDLRFELPQNNDLVQVSAKVKHVYAQNGLYAAGIEYTEVKNYQTSVLVAYLEALYK